MRSLRHSLVTVVALLAVAAAAAGQDVRNAVVRITSHGCSGTVISSERGKTLVLSCAHAFRGQDGQKKLVLDVPWDPSDKQAARQAKMAVVALDAQLDLSLIEIDDGPWPVVCKVAPAGFRPSTNLWSVGYDDMKWPATWRPATVVGQSTDGRVTYTKERP